MLLINLRREADSEALAVGLNQMRCQIRQRNLLLLIKDGGIVHLILENVTGNLDRLVVRLAHDLLTFILYGLIVVCTREPVANSELGAVPFGLVASFLYLFWIRIASFGSFL